MAILAKHYGSMLSSRMESLNLRVLDKGDNFKILPIGLKPVPIPHKEINDLHSIQTEVIDHLMVTLTLNGTILEETLDTVSKTDTFIGRMLEIYRKSLTAQMSSRKPYISVIRSDFFPENGWKLIEMNTVSVAGAFFADGCDQLFLQESKLMDKTNIRKRPRRAELIAESIEIVHRDSKGTSGVVHQSTPGDSERPRARADVQYNDARSNTSCNWKENATVVLVIVEKYYEQNQQDQLGVVNLLTKRSIPVLISTLSDISLSEWKATPESYLHIKGRESSTTLRLSCIYFRGGFDPRDYVNERCWEFLEIAELSKSVLLPSVGLHLSGCKRVQCAIAENNFKILDTIIPDDKNSRLFKSTFVNQFELNEENVKDVLRDPFKFVVKPQREGGSNNLFGESIVSTFSNLHDKSELSKYIAMERIHPRVFRDFPVISKEGEASVVSEAVAEVGICSVMVVDTRDGGHNVLKHELGGLVTKIKSATSNECRISLGFGFRASVEEI